VTTQYTQHFYARVLKDPDLKV